MKASGQVNEKKPTTMKKAKENEDTEETDLEEETDAFLKDFVKDEE